MGLPPPQDELPDESILIGEPTTILGKICYQWDLGLYKIDSIISTVRGQIIGLFISGFLLVFVLIPLNITDAPLVLGNEIFENWLDIFDPKFSGANFGTDNDFGVILRLRFISSFKFVVQFIYFNVVVGFVVDVIVNKMNSLKAGKTAIVEANHSLVLGWSDKTLSFLQQLCLANESEKGGVVVVLCDRDKDTVETEIESAILDTLGTKIIVSNGNPLLATELGRVSAQHARSITIMATDSRSDVSDASVLRTLLTLQALKGGINGHVVADVSDIDNNALMKAVANGIAETLVSHQVIGRLLVMCSRSPHLASVFEDLLGFEGNEFYMKEWPECVGVLFGEIADQFENAVPIGVRTKDGKIVIKPSMNRKIEEGDEVIVLAEDNDTYKASPYIPPASNCGNYTKPIINSGFVKSSRILVCGWRREMRDILCLLDAISPADSEILLVNTLHVEQRIEMMAEEGLDLEEDLRHITLKHVVANTTMRRHMEEIQIGTFDCIMALGDGDREDEDTLHSDSHVLATVLRLRAVELSQKLNLSLERISVSMQTPVDLRRKVQRVHCVAEVLDTRTQKTIEKNALIRDSADYVLLNDFISRILAMISEDRNVAIILDEVLGGKGCSFDVVPSSRYLDTMGEKVSFAELSRRARRQYSELMCGYAVENSVHMNPPEKTNPMSWNDKSIIVLRETPGQMRQRLNKASENRMKLRVLQSFAKKPGLTQVKVFSTVDARIEAELMMNIADVVKEYVEGDDDISPATQENNWMSKMPLTKPRQLQSIESMDSISKKLKKSLSECADILSHFGHNMPTT